MKKFLLLLTFALVLTLFSNSNLLNAQCTPDPNFNTISSFDPDPLPDGCVGLAYSQVVTFVFPEDTTITSPFPITVPFDSFILSSVTNIPAGLNYACNISGCVYVPSGGPAKGCLEISGTPTTPSMDSVEIIGTAWITLIGIATPIASTIKIPLSIFAAGSCPVGISDEIYAAYDFSVSPNPVGANSKVSFELPQPSDVSITIVDLMGREAKHVYTGKLTQGSHGINIDASSLPTGMYMIRMDLNDGEYVFSQKILSQF